MPSAVWDIRLTVVDNTDLQQVNNFVYHILKHTGALKQFQIILSTMVCWCYGNQPTIFCCYFQTNQIKQTICLKIVTYYLQFVCTVLNKWMFQTGKHFVANPYLHVLLLLCYLTLSAKNFKKCLPSCKNKVSAHRAILCPAKVPPPPHYRVIFNSKYRNWQNNNYINSK